MPRLYLRGEVCIEAVPQEKRGKEILVAWRHVVEIAGMYLMVLGLPGVILWELGGRLIDWGEDL